MKLRLTIYSIVSLTLLLLSCNKDDSDGKKICYLSKSTTTNFTSTAYSYSSNGKPTSTAVYDTEGLFSGSYVNEYDVNGNLSKILFKSKTGQTMGYQELEYNIDSLIAKASFYYPELQNYTIIKYNATKQPIQVSYFSNDPGGEKQVSYETFDYNQKGQIQKTNFYLNKEGTSDFVLAFTTEYEYDDKASHLLSQKLIPDNVISISKNNILKKTTKDATGKIVEAESYTSTFEYNKEGYPVKHTLTNLATKTPIVFTYTYDCK